MKIAVPVDDKRLESGICPSFGRTPYFLIFNTDTNEACFLDNSAAASQGGAGIKAAQAIVDAEVNTLLTPRCGENAEEVLSKAEVLIYKTISGTAQQNIDAYRAEQLLPLNEFHKGFHGHEK
ncbi:MAG: dinitrogenase iron-molybdenum cofactor biosynthesis protein [Clostridiales bacterium]|jgi:predicted Fe-Mo cluster-binding NifX family protein|nr:dinitrogenase iron-molybdenum cofactor biosynthesis protein [Clostridiales bacterium]